MPCSTRRSAGPQPSRSPAFASVRNAAPIWSPASSLRRSTSPAYNDARRARSMRACSRVISSDSVIGNAVARNTRTTATATSLEGLSPSVLMSFPCDIRVSFYRRRQRHRVTRRARSRVVVRHGNRGQRAGTCAARYHPSRREKGAIDARSACRFPDGLVADRMRRHAGVARCVRGGCFSAAAASTTSSASPAATSASATSASAATAATGDGDDSGAQWLCASRPHAFACVDGNE